MSEKKHTKMIPQKGGHPRKTYRGKRSVSPEGGEGILAHPEIAKKLTVMELKFLDVYYQTGSGAKAYKACYPNAKPQRCAWGQGTMRKKIREKITQDEEWELFGPSLAKIGKAVDDGLKATFVRSFITRDGEVVETPAYPDYQVRQTAVANAMKLRKLDKGEDGGAINVNIVMYAHPNAPRWPGADDDVVDVTPDREDE